MRWAGYWSSGVGCSDLDLMISGPRVSLLHQLYAREGAAGQAVVCPLLRGSSPTRGVAPKQHRGLGRAFSPAFFGLVLFIPWRVGAEESGAARSEEHTSELQSPDHLVCLLLLVQQTRF